VSSVAHHQSNGLAEAGVKIAKTLLAKSEGWTDFCRRLAARNVMISPTGCLAPATLFFGRQLRGEWPVWRPQKDAPKSGPIEMKEKRHYRRGQAVLEVGQRVRLQNPVTKRWDEQGDIMEIRPGQRSYVVQVKNGKKTIRNIKYLKVVKGHLWPTNTEEMAPSKLCPRLAFKKRY